MIGWVSRDPSSTCLGRGGRRAGSEVTEMAPAFAKRRVYTALWFQKKKIPLTPSRCLFCPSCLLATPSSPGRQFSQRSGAWAAVAVSMFRSEMAWMSFG